MEAAGLAVAIPALVRELGKLADLCRTFYDAPEEISRIRSQLLILNAQLQVIEHVQQVKDPKSDECLPVPLVDACNRALDCAKQTITDIQNAIKRQSGNGFRARLRWSFIGSSQARQLLNNLRGTEINVVVLFSLLSHHQSRTHDTLQDLVSMVLEISQDISSLKATQHHTTEHGSSRESDRLDSATKPRSVESCGLPTYSSTRHFGYFPDRSFNASKLSLSTTWNEEQTTRLLSTRKLLPFSWLIGQRAFVLDFAFRSFKACSFGFSLLSGSWIGVVNIIPDDAEVMTAALRGDLITVRELIRNGHASASDSTLEFNYNPLTNAIESGNVKLVEFLLRNGANVNGIFGRLQTSPLAWALRYRHEEIVRLLLEKGADVSHVSAVGWTPLFYLWTENKPREDSSLRFLKIMSAKDAFNPFDYNLTDVNGWDVFQRATAFGAPEDVRSLISMGAPMDSVYGELKWKPIHHAVFFNNLATLVEIISHSPQFDINTPDERGWTLLHISASAGNYEIVRHLLKRGADPFQKSLPSWSHMPETLYGQQWTPAEVAKAQSRGRYENYVKIVAEFGLSAKVEEEEYFSDAVEYQSKMQA